MATPRPPSPAEHRLPEATLSAEEAEAVLQGPDVTTILGVRDRAILEVLYSTAIRRAELIGLRIWDIDHARGTVFVRQGKGAKDRHVPIGSRALLWVARYFDLVRPKLVAKVATVRQGWPQVPLGHDRAAGHRARRDRPAPGV